MKLVCIVLFLLTVQQRSKSQIANDNLASHISWKRELPDVSVSVSTGAAVDSAGELWLVSDPIGKPPSLLHMNAAGTVVSNDVLPQGLNPPFPELTSFALAALRSGQIGLLAHHFHTIGKTEIYDWADFALIASGKIEPPKRIAGSGPEYTGLLALTDGHFLAMGDEEPMTLVHLDEDGRVDWRKRFPSNWDLPSGAALDDDGSCVVSSEYGAQWLNMIRVDSHGKVLSRARLPGWGGAVASGPSGACALLKHQGSVRKPSVEFSLSSYTPLAKLQWKVSLRIEAPWGGVSHFAALQDGYLVVANEGHKTDVLFMAKYDFSGHQLWHITDPSTSVPDVVVANDNIFYLLSRSQSNSGSTIVVQCH